MPSMDGKVGSPTNSKDHHHHHPEKMTNQSRVKTAANSAVNWNKSTTKRGGKTVDKSFTD